MGAHLVAFFTDYHFYWEEELVICAYANLGIMRDIFLQENEGNYNFKENILLVQWPN